EVLVTGVFDVEGAIGLHAGVRESRGQVPVGALVREVLARGVLFAEGRFQPRARLGGPADVAEVDDAMVVQRAVLHLPVGLDHLDAVESLGGWRVVATGIQVGGRVDRRAILQQQHLARAPRRRGAYADAGAAAEDV